MRLNRKLLFNLYICSLPFSHAFSYYNGLITFTILISVLMLTSIVFTSHLKIGKNLLLYLAPAIIFIFYVILNSIINVQFYNSFFNHVISYIVSALLFLIIPLWYFESFKLKYNIKSLLNWITLMVFFTCLYACSQFIFNNFFGINLDDYLYWPTQEISNTMALGFYFRTKGFFAEPGHFALFLECFIPVIYWYLYKTDIILNFILKNIIFLIIIAAFILTISAAGFACLLFGFLIAVFFSINNLKKKLPKSFIKALLFLGVIFLIYKYTDDYFSVFDIIYTNTIDKLYSGTGSSQDRMSRLVVFYDIVNNMNIADYLFGHGPNATVNLGYPKDLSILLLYHLLFIELGLIGFLLFLAIIFIFISKSFLIKGKLRFYVQASLISVSLHYIFIGNYWYPYLWFLGIFIYLANKLQYNSRTIKH